MMFAKDIQDVTEQSPVRVAESHQHNLRFGPFGSYIKPKDVEAYKYVKTISPGSPRPSPDGQGLRSPSVEGSKVRVAVVGNNVVAYYEGRLGRKGLRAFPDKGYVPRSLP